MTVTVTAPGHPTRHLTHLLLDVNGTLTRAGTLLPGIPDRLARLREHLDVTLVTADTFGTLPAIAAALGDIPTTRISTGSDKLALTERLGAAACAAIGNGANDEAMLRAAGLAIAVLGPEGVSPRTLAAADIVCTSILDALDLLHDPRMLSATLRA